MLEKIHQKCLATEKSQYLMQLILGLSFTCIDSIVMWYGIEVIILWYF